MPAQRFETTSSPAAMFDFSFNRFITVGIIKFIYGLLLLLVLLGWLIITVTGYSQVGFLGGFAIMILAAIWACVEVILVRVGLELVVVLFRIGENTSLMAGAPAPVHHAASVEPEGSATPGGSQAPPPA